MPYGGPTSDIDADVVQRLRACYEEEAASAGGLKSDLAFDHLELEFGDRFRGIEALRAGWNQNDRTRL